MKKKRNVQPQSRFSLGHRIAVYYAVYLLRAIPLRLLFFALLYTLLVAPGLYQDGQALIAGAQAGNIPKIAYAYCAVLDEEGAVTEGYLPEGAPEASWRFTRPQGRMLLAYYRPNGSTSSFALVFDVTRQANMLWGLLGALALFDLIQAWRLSLSGRRIGGRLFKPIDDIARTAEKLTGNNLSERINVEGTRSELQELATVINAMLDRIEGAYNSQKQFVSDASHELRTPIAVIQGYAEMLDRWGKSDPEVRDESIAAILSETEGMKELVEKLLFLARHDAHTIAIERQYFDAKELVEELARDTDLIDDTHAIKLGALQSCIVFGDRATLKQALRIFADNALKYTPDGGVITLSCTVEPEACRVTVADNGAGIAPEDMTRVFDRFYRAESARDKNVEGHGLGLSIARIIVLSHGGRIEVESKIGVGSRFHLLLPR